MSLTGEAAPPRRRVWRRLAQIAALLVVVIAVTLAVLIIYLRPIAEHQLALALGTPVTLESLSIRPGRSLIEAKGLVLGPADAHLSAAQMTIAIDVWQLLRGSITVDEVDCTGLVATVAIDPSYHVTVTGLPIPVRDRTAPSATAPLVRRLQIRRLVASDATITVRHVIEGKSQDVAVHFDSLVAKDIAVGTDGSGLQLEAEATGGAEGVSFKAQASVLPAGTEQLVEARLDVQEAVLPNRLIALPPTVADLKGTLSGSVTYRSDSSHHESGLRVDAQLESLRLAGRAKTALAAGSVRIQGLHADLLTSRVDLGTIAVKAPAVTLALTPDGLVLPVEFQTTSDRRGGAWTVSGGQVQLSAGSLTLQGTEQRYDAEIESGKLEGISATHVNAIRLVARPTSGGSAEVSGTLQLEPTSNVDLKLNGEGLSVASLAGVLPALPLRIARGTASADVAISGALDAPAIRGTLKIDDVHTLPPEGAPKQHVLACNGIEMSFSVAPDRHAIDIASLTLRYPYAMVDRSADGIFPYSALAPHGDSQRPAMASGATAVSIKQLKIIGGRADFVDRGVTPHYWTALADVAATASGVTLPGINTGNVWLTARQDEINPVDATGEADGDVWRISAGCKSVFLPTLNAYLAPLLGYEVTTGILSLDLTGSISLDAISTTNRVKLVNVSLSQTGLDFIQRETGVPLPIALALLADTAGSIELAVSVQGDPRSGTFQLGSMINQALSKAVRGALATPLKLLGRLFGSQGPPRALAIDPIPFVAGSSTLDALARIRLAQIARILAAHTEVTLVAKPEISALDIAAVGAGDVQALADARAKAVSGALVGGEIQPRLERKRLVMVPWKPEPGGAPSERTGVYVELQLSADYGS